MPNLLHLFIARLQVFPGVWSTYPYEATALFPSTILTTAVRIKPETFGTEIAMNFDVMGCAHEGKNCCKICNASTLHAYSIKAYTFAQLEPGFGRKIIQKNDKSRL